MSQHSPPRDRPASTQEAGSAEALAIYSAYGVAFTVEAPSDWIHDAVDFVYGEMRASEPMEVDLEIKILPRADDPALLDVLFNEEAVFEAARLGDLMHELDNQLSAVFQSAVPALYFVHGAALADDHGVTLLVGESGAGKSTTAYALVASGLEYLTDELSAIDLDTFGVYPYPRAICLKNDPPAPLKLPIQCLRTERTLHVRPRDMTPHIASGPRPLRHIVFLKYSPLHTHAQLKALSRGEASMLFYQSSLNTLAHDGMGLDAALGLLQHATCHELLAAGVRETVELIRGLGRDGADQG